MRKAIGELPAFAKTGFSTVVGAGLGMMVGSVTPGWVVGGGVVGWLLSSAADKAYKKWGPKHLTEFEGPEIEMTIVQETTSVEDGFSWGIPVKPGGSDREFRIGLRSSDAAVAPLTRVVIESVSKPWTGVVVERPLRLLSYEGPAARVPYGTGPTVFAVLATQPGQFKDGLFTYHDGDEKTSPHARKEDRQTLLTIRATGETGRASYLKIRMCRTMGSLRWKIDDGIPSPPISLAELVGENNAWRIRSAEFVKDFEERKKS